MNKSENIYKYGIITIFVIGIIFRITLFFINPSYFYDESSLILNVINLSFKDLFNGLSSLQVAPPFFLLLSKLIYEIISPENDYLRDLSFRIIPLISGIAVLPVFYFFLKKFVKNKWTILSAFFILTFNTAAINYCALAKQYSTELLVSVILLCIFYRILFENKHNWYDIICILLAPWFSLSSFFIIASGFILMIKKNWKLLLIFSGLFLVNCVVFYFTYLKGVCSVNYKDMVDCWVGSYGFLDIRHPLRLFIRVGELFAYNKAASIIMGITAVASIIIYLLRINLKKIFLLIPLGLVLIASFLHQYPIGARLILFLMPLFAISIAEYNLKFKKVFILTFCTVTLFLSIFYFIFPHSTSHREASHYLEKIVKPTDTIIIDGDHNTYKYYIQDKIPHNNVIQIHYFCNNLEQEALCTEFLYNNLKPGKYWFIVPTKVPVEIIGDNKTIIQTELLRRSTLIYFEQP